MFKAVIFDMDGLMFDTERVGYHSWVRASEEFGIKGVDLLYDQMLGATQEFCRELFIKTYGTDESFDEICARESQYRREMIINEGIPIKKGLLDLINTLRAYHIPIAVATSSKRDVVDLYLGLAGIADSFDAIVSGEEVQNSKPHPEIFLKACEKLAVAPSDAIALEDSFNGIRSAYAGGLHALMIPDMKQPDEEMRQKASAILPDLHAVIDWIVS